MMPSFLHSSCSNWASFTMIALACVLCETAAADVFVVANRTTEVVEFEVRSGESEWQHYRLRPDECEPISIGGASILRSGESGSVYEVRPYGVYFFGDFEGRLPFEEIGFTSTGPTPETDREHVGDRKRELAEYAAVEVRLCFDDELYERKDPEGRLRKRFDAAAEILERIARVRFIVVGTERWESIDGVSDFEGLLIDFERKVDVEPGALAIGFSKQASRSKKRLGGTRLPLHSHILVRDRGSRVLSERAYVEVLVHELGHYLGAAHSPEWSSAMRPKLADGLAESPRFVIGLDPVNTMIAFRVGEQLRSGSVSGCWDFDRSVRTHLRDLYANLSTALPEDPVSGIYLQALELKAPPIDRPPTNTPLSRFAARIVEAVTQSAIENVQREPRSVAKRYGRPHRVTGDELTEAYIRQAARAAMDIPKDIRAQAFAVGLAVALDGSGRLRDNPLTGITWRSVETVYDSRFRSAVLGEPTIRGRSDLSLHFAVSVGLAALYGSRLAEAAGVWKERTDGTFSRADYSADLAGIRFYEHMAADPDRIGTLADRFRIADYLPACEESTSESVRVAPAGSPNTHATQQIRAGILREIDRLPAYQD